MTNAKQGKFGTALKVGLGATIDTILSDYSKWLFDIDEDSADKLQKEGMRYYRRNDSLVWVKWPFDWPKGEKGNQFAWNLSYINPLGDLKSMGKSVVNGDWEAAFARFGETPLIDIWMSIKKGVNPFTQIPVRHPRDSFWLKLGDTLGAIIQDMYTPSSLPTPYSGEDKEGKRRRNDRAMDNKAGTIRH